MQNLIKKLIKDSSNYAFGNLLSKIIGFITVIFYTKYLSIEEFGKFDYIFAIGAILGVLIPLEVGQAIQRYYPFYNKNKDLQNQLISTAFFISAFMFILFIISIILLNFIFNIFDPVLMIACFCMFFLNSAIYLTSSILIAQTASKLQTYFSLLNQLISLTSSLIFIVYFNFQSLGIVLGQSIGSVGALFIFSHTLRDCFKSSISVQMAKKILRFSLPLVPSSVGVIGMMYLDRIMLESFLGLREIGLYGISARTSAISLIFILALRTSISPLIYQNYKDPNLPYKLASYLKYYMVTSFIALLIAELLSADFIGLIFGLQYIDAHAPVSVLVFSLFISNLYMFFPGIILSEKTIILTLINLVGLFLNIPLNLVLIPNYGITGAAIATLTSSAIALSIHIRFSQAYFPIKIKVSHALLIILGATFLLIMRKLYL